MSQVESTSRDVLVRGLFDAAVAQANPTQGTQAILPVSLAMAEALAGIAERQFGPTADWLIRNGIVRVGTE